MPVKNTRSKLVQGVRQIKAQQDGAQSAVTAEAARDVGSAVTTPAAGDITTPAAARPDAARVRGSTVLHPDRVWPD